VLVAFFNFLKLMLVCFLRLVLVSVFVSVLVICDTIHFCMLCHTPLQDRSLTDSYRLVYLWHTSLKKCCGIHQHKIGLIYRQSSPRLFPKDFCHLICDIHHYKINFPIFILWLFYFCGEFRQVSYPSHPFIIKKR
jgi:hypothetical protein